MFLGGKSGINMCSPFCNQIIKRDALTSKNKKLAIYMYKYFSICVEADTRESILVN